jgi:hypothetical protein
MSAGEPSFGDGFSAALGSSMYGHVAFEVNVRCQLFAVT